MISEQKKNNMEFRDNIKIMVENQNAMLETQNNIIKNQSKKINI